MSDYQSLARKFRPQTFQDVCEQDFVVKTLKNAIALNRVSHAYLFSGSRGTGKTTLARIFAKALNCKNLSANYEPCNECSSCKEISSSSSLDVLEIDGASNRGIDDIRKLNETTLYTPSSSKYRIYIIDEVHMLTKEAFNALLKTLEEPPSNVKFFFATTEPHKVLPTILSRVQRFDLKRISAESICHKLRKILASSSVILEEEALLALASAASGSLRDAESLLDQILCTDKKTIGYDDLAQMLGFCSLEHFFKLDIAFAKQDISFAFTLSKYIFDEGKDFSHFLDSLLSHFKRILQIKLTNALPLELSQKQKEKYAETAKYYTESQCLYILEYLMKWVEVLSKTELKKVYLEMMLLEIIRSKSKVFVEDLISRFEALSGKEPEATKSLFKQEMSLEAPTLTFEDPEEIDISSVEPSPEKEILLEEPVINESPVELSLKEEPVKESILAEAPIQMPAFIETESAANKEPSTPDLENILQTDLPHEDKAKSHLQENLLRFASVELNGTLRRK